MHPITRTILKLCCLATLSAPAHAQLTITIDEETETFTITGSVDVSIRENLAPPGQAGFSWGSQKLQTLGVAIPIPQEAIATTDPIVSADIRATAGISQLVSVRWVSGTDPQQAITGTGVPVSYADAPDLVKRALEASIARTYACNFPPDSCEPLTIDSPTAQIERIRAFISPRSDSTFTPELGVRTSFETLLVSLSDQFTNGFTSGSTSRIVQIVAPYGPLEPAFFGSRQELLDVFNGTWTFVLETEPGVTHTYEAELRYELPLDALPSFTFGEIENRDPFPQPFEFRFNFPGPEFGFAVSGSSEDSFRVSARRLGGEFPALLRTENLPFETQVLPDDFLSRLPAFPTRFEFNAPVFTDRSLAWRSETVTGTPGAPEFVFIGDGGIFTSSATIEFNRAVNGCLADANFDGVVGMGDFGEFAAEFLRDDCIESIGCKFDLDADGDVDLGDFGVFGAEFGRTDCND